MKILFVNFTMNIGGIETFLMNIVRNIDLKSNNVSFLCYSHQKFDYEDQINDLGLNIIKIDNPSSELMFFKYISQLKKVIKDGNYDVIHCNTYFDSAYVMYAAYKCNVKVRITHSHTSQGLIPKNIIQNFKWKIARYMLNKYSTKRIACSNEAGIALFNKYDFEILENGVDIDKFLFNSDKRDQLRKIYNLPFDAIVIGHVGRFAKVKNHKFIINIFEKLLRLDNNYYLILIGDGPEFSSIQDLINDKQLKNHVILTGNVNDVNNFYNMMDLMIFPSLYEGLPVSLIEAQINGLKIIASDHVSKEIDVTKNINFIPLDNSDELWINSIKNVNGRNINNDYFINSKYNIKNIINKLFNIYNDK